MGKKKFYDDYDALFETKPVKKNPVSKAKPSSKKEVEKSSGARPAFLNRKTLIWLGVFVILFGARFYYRTVAPFLHVLDYDYEEVDVDDYDDDDYIDAEDEMDEIYPLKEAGLANDPNRDLTQPLHVGLKDKTFTFTPNYQLEVKGDVDIVYSREELSLLPTNEDYPDTKHVADISIYGLTRRATEVDMKMSRNVIESTEIYTHGDDVVYTKAYPQKDIEDVKNGYVYSYEDDTDYATIKLFRYFIFSNGTGIVLRIYSDSDEIKDVSGGISFEEVKKWYPQEMKALEESFQLKKVVE